MNVAEIAQKGKDLVGRIPRDVGIFLLFILCCSTSFGLGIWVSQDAGQGSSFSMKVVPQSASVADALPGKATQGSGQVVASKNGSKYYLPTCSGASRITPANKIWFKTIEDARAQGYTPAANCPGL